MSRVKYILTVEVDDEKVFQGTYADSAGLEQKLYMAEKAVETALDLGLEEE